MTRAASAGTMPWRESIARWAIEPTRSSRRSARSCSSELEKASTSGRSEGPPAASVLAITPLPVQPAVFLKLQAEQVDEALGGAVVELVLPAVGGEQLVVDAELARCAPRPAASP